MKGRVLSLSAVLCLAISITGVHICAAQQVQPLEPEWLRQMYEEGWQKVQEGVLQRDMGGGRYETFGYGAEGLQWIGQGYRQRVEGLKSRYDASPSEELAQAIDQLEGEILRLEGIAQETPAAESFDGDAIESCALSYGGSSFAEPQSGALGATARASSYFHNDCGHLGDTFTTAYARAVASTGETTVTHSDPKNGGTWLDSFSSVSASGSSGCESWAQASVTSTALGISYQTPLAQNYKCRRGPLRLDPNKITLDGPGSDGDPRRLADEQSLVGDPRAGDSVDVTSYWMSSSGAHVNMAIIDLGAIYRIERIYIYDRNGAVGGEEGYFTITAGSSTAGWTDLLVSDDLGMYMKWKGFPNDPTNDGAYFSDDPALEFSSITTRYLRVVHPNGLDRVPEIVVYGTLVSP